jgi:multiple sugar transport system substrate-binding protein
MDVAWAGQFAASDWLSDLGEYTSPEDLDAFFSRVVREADHYEGTLIALPVYIDGGVLYYRTDLLEQLGRTSPPQTWSELVTLSQEITPERNDFYGFVWQGAQYEGLICNFLEFAGSNGGGIRIEQGAVHVNTPENREAVEFMKALIHEYEISPPSTYTEMKEEEVRLWFQQGKAMFERNWPYAWKLHQSDDSPVQGKVGIAPLPHFADGESKSTLGGWHVGISKHSDNKEDAWRLVEFITSRETQTRLALELGWNPGRVEVYTDSTVLEQMPHFAELRDVFDNAIARPHVPYYSQLSTVLQRRLNSVLAEKTPVDEALATAESEMTEIVKRYKR